MLETAPGGTTQVGPAMWRLSRLGWRKRQSCLLLREQLELQVPRSCGFCFMLFSFIIFFLKGIVCICTSQKHRLLQPTVWSACYAMPPKGIRAGPLASTVLKRLAWQLLGVHLPCQRLMETTGRDFYSCYVESLDIFWSCCRAGTCLGALWGVKQRFKTKGWWGIGRTSSS